MINGPFQAADTCLVICRRIVDTHGNIRLCCLPYIVLKHAPLIVHDPELLWENY